MLIIDSLIISGVRFVLDKVVQAVDKELSDDTVLREELLAAQMRRELGEISEEEFAETGEDLLFDRGELVVGDLAELELHLRSEELLAEMSLVVHLGLDRLRETREDELDSTDDEGVDDEHYALSSFRRMLTKL